MENAFTAPVAGLNITGTDCTEDGYVLKYSTGDSAWTCAADDAGSGSVTWPQDISGATGNEIFTNGTDNFLGFNGTNNLYLGTDAGRYLTTGTDNTLIGVGAGDDVTEGDYNTLIGRWAGSGVTTESLNVIIGESAGSGSQNGMVVAGGWALFDKDVVAQRSVVLGSQAMENAEGYLEYNVVIGHRAGRHLEDLPSASGDGDGNVFIGRQAGENSTTANNNVFVGRYAGFSNTIGTRNIFIGLDAGDNNTEGVRNIIIGQEAQNDTPTTDDYLNIGEAIYGDMGDTSIDGGQASLTIDGDLTINRNAGDTDGGDLTVENDLEVTGTASKTGGGSWSVLSDERLKDVHGTYDRGLEDILKLNPITFSYKEGNDMNLPSDTEEIGFIAQDVQKVFPEAVSEKEEGYLDLNVHPINIAMVGAVKDLKAENDALRAELAAMRAEISDKLASLNGTTGVSAGDAPASNNWMLMMLAGLLGINVLVLASVGLGRRKGE